MLAAGQDRKQKAEEGRIRGHILLTRIHREGDRSIERASKRAGDAIEGAVAISQVLACAELVLSSIQYFLTGQSLFSAQRSKAREYERRSRTSHLFMFTRFGHFGPFGHPKAVAERIIFHTTYPHGRHVLESRIDFLFDFCSAHACSLVLILKSKDQVV